MPANTINTATFHKLLEGHKPVLVDFWAPWCGYCRRITVPYDRIADQYGDEIHITKINIDEESALADSLGIEIIPTLVLYRDGKAIASITAPESKAAIENFLKEALA